MAWSLHLLLLEWGLYMPWCSRCWSESTQCFITSTILSWCSRYWSESTQCFITSTILPNLDSPIIALGWNAFLNMCSAFFRLLRTPCFEINPYLIGLRTVSQIEICEFWFSFRTVSVPIICSSFERDCKLTVYQGTKNLILDSSPDWF